MGRYLIYGANGYTGSLIARMAHGRGQQPVLAGRNGAALAELARELPGLEQRVFDLGDPGATRAALEGVSLVLHCAGPFAHTYRAMADACLATGAHYLDVTGEIAVFEGLAARTDEARNAGVMLLPGVGFDVVPTDCLAAHLKRRLPTATRLALGFAGGGRLSRGTATTMVENLARGGCVRRGGALMRVPAAYKVRAIDFGRGPRVGVTIPWGDVSTAWYSTGIPDIEVYLAAPGTARSFMRASRYLGWLLGSRPVQRWLKARIARRPPGPTDEERVRRTTYVWGEVTDELGARAVARLRGPEGYTWTALAALKVVERVLDGTAAPGFQTPSRLFGPDFVLEVPGVERRDG